MENSTETLRGQKIGSGLWRISAEIDGTLYTTTTNNMPAVDVAFDDCYDDVIGEDRYYQTQEEAREQLVSEIETAHLL